MSASPTPERARPSRPLRLALLGLLLVLVPIPVACQLTGPGFEQVPPVVREKVARSEARGGPYADPPLERYPKALVDPSEVTERLDGLEARLAAAESEGREARGVAVSVGELSRDRDEVLAETVRVEAEVAREGRERLAEEVDELGTELEVRTGAAASEVDQLEAEFASALAHETEQNARLTDLEATIEALDADLARRVIELEARADDDADTAERLDAIEVALALPPAPSEEVAALRAELDALETEFHASTTEPRSGSMLTSASSSYLAFGLADAGLLIVVLAVIALLVLTVLRMRADRERERHSMRVFTRIEDAVRALDEHVARQAARDEERSAEAARREAAVEPEPVVVVEEPEAEAPGPEGPADEAPVVGDDAPERGGRWERFVERVEGQREEPERVVIERPRPAPSTRQPRVLDRGFLERYRGRGANGPRG